MHRAALAAAIATIAAKKLQHQALRIGALGQAAIAASHGGTYAAYLAAKAGIKAVILCDAGVGRERAGIGGLDYLGSLGVAAAAIGHRSARIGHGGDCHARGVITYANSH